MKKTILFILFFFTILIVAQEKKTATNGTISFEASVPFYEAVEAKNNQVFSVFNTKNGNITFMAIIKNFRFERSLMQDHFNAHYMESDKYPKATFKGQIEKFAVDKLKSTPSQYYIKGKINIHGVTKHIKVLANVTKTTKNSIVIQSEFSINTNDFKVEIPFIVRNKISQNVNIKLHTELH